MTSRRSRRRRSNGNDVISTKFLVWLIFILVTCGWNLCTNQSKTFITVKRIMSSGGANNDPDPGRGMRRLARVGALLCTLMTLAPFGWDWKCMWQRIDWYYYVASGHMTCGYSLPFYGLS